jgi:cellulose synthase/poly-beta-1,6-N-acetylglucosamine synthase-like glycosyltransferase
VSIVIPILNAVDDVADCIASIRALDYPADRFEIIVVDNGSTDGTPDALDRAGVRWFARPERGRAKALNTGLAHARGAVICTTDMSCRLDPQWMREIVSTFANPDVGCVAGEIRMLGTHRSPALEFQERTNYMSPMPALRRDRVPFLPYADGANASFRREVFDAIGGFEESFFKGADVEICYRMFMLTDYKIVFNHRAVVREPGEPDLRALLKQRYRIGLGAHLMQLKYPGLYRHDDAPAGIRSRYWVARRHLSDFVRTLGAGTRGLWNHAARAEARDASIRLLMGLAQRYGKWRGRTYVESLAVRPRPIEPSAISSFLTAGGSVRDRVIEIR